MNPYLVNVLPFGPELVGLALDRIPSERLDERLDLARFSPREVIAHLADWEPILLTRMRQSVAHPGGPIEAHDESQRAIAQDYASSDPAERLRYWTVERAGTVAWLKGLHKEDWDKVGFHPERGQQSVSDQANMILGHDLYHVRQLADYER